MSAIPKMASTVAVMILAVLVCVSMISACLMIATAYKHHSDVIAEIRESNLDIAVINEKVQEMNEKGFALSVSEEINVSSVKYCEVVLSYKLTLPIFGHVYSGRLVGYAYPGANLTVTR